MDICVTQMPLLKSLLSWIDLCLQPSFNTLKQIKYFPLNIIIISESIVNMPPPFQNIVKDRLSYFKSTGNLTLFWKVKEQYNTWPCWYGSSKKELQKVSFKKQYERSQQHARNIIQAQITVFLKHICFTSWISDVAQKMSLYKNYSRVKQWQCYFYQGGLETENKYFFSWQ